MSSNLITTVLEDSGTVLSLSQWLEGSVQPKQLSGVLHRLDRALSEALKRTRLEVETVTQPTLSELMQVQLELYQELAEAVALIRKGLWHQDHELVAQQLEVLHLTSDELGWLHRSLEATRRESEPRCLCCGRVAEKQCARCGFLTMVVDFDAGDLAAYTTDMGPVGGLVFRTWRGVLQGRWCVSELSRVLEAFRSDFQEVALVAARLRQLEESSGEEVLVACRGLTRGMELLQQACHNRRLSELHFGWARFAQAWTCLRQTLDRLSDQQFELAS